MYVLILMTCVHLQCEYLEVTNEYKTLAACEVAMEAKYDEIEDGQGLLCVEKQPETDSIRT